ncbi:unnamed protein product, partial [Prorocentrum cordatum]
MSECEEAIVQAVDSQAPSMASRDAKGRTPPRRRLDPFGVLWKMIIRPPRAEYTVDELGPKAFRIPDAEGRYCREDIQLQNLRGERLECSHFRALPAHADAPVRFEHVESVIDVSRVNLTYWRNKRFTCPTVHRLRCRLAWGRPLEAAGAVPADAAAVPAAWRPRVARPLGEASAGPAAAHIQEQPGRSVRPARGAAPGGRERARAGSAAMACGRLGGEKGDAATDAVWAAPSPCRARASLGARSVASGRSSILSARSGEGDLVALSLACAKADPLFGATVRKVFGECAFYGQVISIDRDIHSGERAYHVAYEDGDEEHLSEPEVRGALVRTSMAAAHCPPIAGAAAAGCHGGPRLSGARAPGAAAPPLLAAPGAHRGGGRRLEHR